ncbi:MAG: response regulator [Chloroflexota bacterium]|nr:response regulator [Chloroflexota bacterium]
MLAGTPAADGGNHTAILRQALQSVLTQAHLATSARAVGLAVPTATPGTFAVTQAVGTGLTVGSVLVADTVPGLRVLDLPAPDVGLPAPAGALLVLRGMVNTEPGAALAICLAALAALVQVGQSMAPAPTLSPLSSPITRPLAKLDPPLLPLPLLPDAAMVLDAWLQRVVERVAAALGADLVAVAVRDAVGDAAWRAAVGRRATAATQAPADARLIASVIAAGRPQILADLAAPALRAAFPTLAAEGVRTALAVPLASAGPAHGVLLIAWRTLHPPTAADGQAVPPLAREIAATLEQQAAAAPAPQQAFLESLIAHVPAGIVSFSVPDFRVRQANPFFLQFLDEPFRSGARPVLGLQLAEFIPQARESGVQAIYENVAASGQPFTINEFEFQGFARGVTYWNWSLVPLREQPTGPVSGVLLLVSEVTTGVRANRRLSEALDVTRRQAAELDGTIQQMVEGVAVVDRDGNLTKINPAGVALLGRGIIALEPGVDYAERYGLCAVDGTPCAAADLPLEQARNGTTISGQDLLVRRPDGSERVLSVSAAPLYNEAGRPNGAVAVFHDVTRTRELERLKDEFLAIVSHELRTPLAAILGYSDLMLRGAHGPLTAKQTRSQEAVKRNAQRLLTLINDLLDVSKLEARSVELHPTTLDLHAAVPKAVAGVQVLAAERGVSLSHEIADRVPPVWADEDRLQQVMTNLLSNAIKFTPSGGTVLVRVQPSALPATAPADHAESALTPREVASVVISVQDTGVGLEAAALPHIWDRFYQADSTTSRRFGGTGLGLSIVKTLVELHGGHIAATSAGADRGSTFLFRLPLAPSLPVPPPLPDATLDAEAGTPAAPAEPDTPLVLVIEDNADLAAIVRGMLEGAGYRVAVAADGTAGLAAAGRLRPAAILLDLLLPQAGGWDVLQRLKADPTTADVPVVVVSILEQQRLGLLLGATGYLVKPLDRDRLLGLLRGLAPPGVTAPHALVVDDEAGLREALVEMLQAAGFVVSSAEDGVVALERIAAARPDIVLLDLLMPRLDGFAVLEWLRGHTDAAIREVPVVLVTAKTLNATERAELAAATQALIPKVGLSLGELLRAIKETLEKLNVKPDHDDSADPARGRT